MNKLLGEQPLPIVLRARFSIVLRQKAWSTTLTWSRGSHHTHTGAMGVLCSGLRYAGPIFRQSYPPEPEFSTSHIPDLTGRVILVTGMHTDPQRLVFNAHSDIPFQVETQALGRRLLGYCSADAWAGLNTNLVVTYTQVLLEHNAKVYMAARDRKKAEAAIEELKEKTGREAFFLELNLANLASVRKAAEAFLT